MPQQEYLRVSRPDRRDIRAVAIRAGVAFGIIVALMTVLSLHLSVAPGAARANGPSLTLAPRNGVPNTAVLASGSGFTPGEDVGILWHAQNVRCYDCHANLAVANTQADSSGSFQQALFHVFIHSYGGTTQVTAHGYTSGLTASSSFTTTRLLPGVVLSPVAGIPGQTITAMAGGFIPGEPLTVFWGSPALTATAVLTGFADSQGLLHSFQVTVPSTAISGTYAVAVTGGWSALDGEAEFTVSATGATLQVQPASGPSGTMVTTSGQGFQSYEMVNIRWDSLTGSSLGTAYTNGSGAFTGAGFFIPSASVGQHQIVAQGQTSGQIGVTPFLVTSAPPAGAAAATTGAWPTFHGNSQRTGWNPSETVLTPATVAGLHMLWAITTTNGIASSPAVVNGAVYVGGQDGLIRAVDANTGQLRWTVPTSGAITAAPTVASGIVYIGGEDLTMYALKAQTGHVRWTSPVTDAVLGAPAVVGAKLYVGSRDATLYQFNRNTGHLAWSLPDDEGGFVGAPAQQGHMLYYSESSGLFAFDTRTNKMVWTSLLNDHMIASPVIVSNTLLCATQIGTLTAFNAHTTATLWVFRVSAELDATPAVANGLVYEPASDGWLHAIDLATGNLVWRALIDPYAAAREVGPQPGISNPHGLMGAGCTLCRASSPVVAGGVVYVGSPDHYLYAFDAGTGALLWTDATGGAIWSSPAVSNGQVYIGSDDGALYAFGLGTGQTPARRGVSAR